MRMDTKDEDGRKWRNYSKEEKIRRRVIKIIAGQEREGRERRRG